MRGTNLAQPTAVARNIVYREDLIINNTCAGTSSGDKLTDQFLYQGHQVEVEVI